MRSRPENRSAVHPVDITGNERRVGTRIQVMHKLAESFARGARRSLPFLVRRRARLAVNRAGIPPVLLDERPVGPICQVTLEAKGTRGWAAIRLDGGAIQLIVDGSLGGAPPEEGAEPEPPPANLSLAQRALVARVARALALDFSEAMREAAGVRLDFVRSESMRSGEEPSLPKDAIVAECAFEGVNGKATLWLFAAGDLLESSGRLDALSPAVMAGDPKMTEALAEVPLEVVAELGRVKLGLRRVLSLKPGEVLRLPTATDDPIQVRVGGLLKLSGSPVISRGQLSVQISGRHED